MLLPPIFVCPALSGGRGDKSAGAGSSPAGAARGRLCLPGAGVQGTPPQKASPAPRRERPSGRGAAPGLRGCCAWEAVRRDKRGKGGGPGKGRQLSCAGAAGEAAPRRRGREVWACGAGPAVRGLRRRAGGPCRKMREKPPLGKAALPGAAPGLRGCGGDRGRGGVT